MQRAAVIMTAHNTAPYIGEALASVRESLTHVEGWTVEVRVGVDHCRATAAALDALREPYWWSDVRVGSFILRNSLVGLGSADAYLSFDSDDVMLPDYLPRVLAALPTDGIAGVARCEVDAGLQYYDPPRTKVWRALGGSCALSHAAWARLGGYWTGHPIAMDTELMDRARKAGLPWGFDDTLCFLRRRNPTSLTQHPDTCRVSSARQAAVDELEERAKDAELIHVPPVTTPLVRRLPALPRFVTKDQPMRVAVLVAAYRAAAWLPDCLASIEDSAAACPTHHRVELRVGVDGCGETAAALDALREPYWWSTATVGPYVLRNSLAGGASVDAYVMFDADDVMHVDFLPRVIRALRRADIAGPSRIECSETLEPLADGQTQAYVNGICGIRADAWAALGGYRAERVAADSDLIRRAAMVTAEDGSPRPLHLVTIHEPLYLRRQHPGSLTRAEETGSCSQLRALATRRMMDARQAGEWQNHPFTVPLERRPRPRDGAV